MSNVRELKQPDAAEIEVLKSADYLQAVNEVSAIIEGLSLNESDNDRLISSIIKQTEQGRKDAFMQGFDMGMKFMED